MEINRIIQEEIGHLYLGNVKPCKRVAMGGKSPFPLLILELSDSVV